MSEVRSPRWGMQRPTSHPKRALARAAVCLAMLLQAACGDPSALGPPVVEPPYRSQDELIEGLATSYRTQDVTRFANLFPVAADNAPYTFFPDPASLQPGQPTCWDAIEELRLQQRMFHPRP